jgi:hypothetical protein
MCSIGVLFLYRCKEMVVMTISLVFIPPSKQVRQIQKISYSLQALRIAQLYLVIVQGNCIFKWKLMSDMYR